MVSYYFKEGRKLLELETPKSGCWVNITPPFTIEELETYAAQFQIPLDFLTDSLDIDERSRYEIEEKVKLILVNTPILNKVESENDPIYTTAPIGIILTPDNVITISPFESPVLNLFINGKIRSFNNDIEESEFVLQILEQNVYRFLSALKRLNLKRGQIEKELLDSSRNQELRQLLSIEKSLVYFVNSLSSNELLKMKIKRIDFLKIRNNEALTDLFEDILIDNGQALDMANIYTNILNGTMDAYSSIISNNLTHVMKQLTLITIVLMVPTLFASFYGMNIPLPFSESAYSWIFIFVFSIVVSIVLIWYFQRKRLF